MKTPEICEVAERFQFCHFQPHQLYPWDMISALASDLINVRNNLDYYRRGFMEATERGEGAVELAQGYKDSVLKYLMILAPLCDRLELRASNERQKSIRRRIFGLVDVQGFQTQMMAAALEDLLTAIDGDCSGLHFAFIPSGKVQFFEQDALFGDAVNAAFPSAKPEIKNAGNCLAADLPDAAVFYLMRAAEHGLRALARHLKVRVGLPLDYACWDHVIRAVKKKLVRLDAKPKGEKKATELELYERVLMECTYFKDAWRNPVSHTRGRFSEAGALDAFGHARDFMRRLSERVKEKS
jgi:hypothetical protein